MNKSRSTKWAMIGLRASIVMLGLVLLVTAGDAAQKKPASKHCAKMVKSPWCAPRPGTARLGRPARDVHVPNVAGSPTNVDPIDLKVLVISADGSEADLPAIKQALDYVGTPYDVYIAQQTPGGLTADKLWTGVHAYYQGVILTTADLVFYNGTAYQSALTDTEWQNLWSFEAQFGIRQVNWYAFPNASLGWTGNVSARDTTTQPASLTFTLSGQAVFSYLNTANPITVTQAWTYFAPAATDGFSDPLLTDSAGNCLALVRTYADGRKQLTLTFDSNQYLKHDLLLQYGLVRWVTNGLFLGERHAYLDAQVDDVFLDSDLYPDPNSSFRITDVDASKVLAYQLNVRKRPTTRAFVFDMVFNGVGTTAGFTDTPDELTPYMKSNQAQFRWIDHTFDHEVLDGQSTSFTSAEITQNNNIARNMGFVAFDKRNVVTPEVSGLSDANAMQGLFNAGIRFMVSDTSKAGQNNPTPNAGIYNALQPSILELPRHPTNLYYNVSTPTEWANEYNSFYASYWGRNLSYAEILDKESEMMLGYMLRGDMDPLMFHQANFRAYDGTHFLLGDLIDATLNKYEAASKVPLLSPAMQDLAGLFSRRMTNNNSGLTAQIIPIGTEGYPNGQITITSQVNTTLPITGLHAKPSTTVSVESYAGDTIAYVKLTAGQPVSLPLQ